MDSFTLVEPKGQAIPLLYDSPHSGRYYPADFVTKPPRRALWMGEDAYVDRLIGGAEGQGCTLLLANYPRCYIDLNRDTDDIDAALLSSPWPGPVRPSAKTKNGIGLIRRYVSPGVEVHAGLLTPADVQSRIDRVYLPYHDALRSTLDRLRAQFGKVWHVDWHSMKSVGNAMTPDGAARRPDFVLGDLDGRAAEPELTAAAHDFLAACGYRVSVNDPYKGATISRRYGAPAEGISTLQIEINRALYLDEVKVETHGGFPRLRDNIAHLTAHLSALLA